MFFLLEANKLEIISIEITKSSSVISLDLKNSVKNSIVYIDNLILLTFSDNINEFHYS